jgi:hypothetical protein
LGHIPELIPTTRISAPIEKKLSDIRPAKFNGPVQRSGAAPGRHSANWGASRDQQPRDVSITCKLKRSVAIQINGGERSTVREQRTDCVRIATRNSGMQIHGCHVMSARALVSINRSGGPGSSNGFDGF